MTPVWQEGQKDLLELKSDRTLFLCQKLPEVYLLTIKVKVLTWDRLLFSDLGFYSSVLLATATLAFCCYAKVTGTLLPLGFSTPLPGTVSLCAYQLTCSPPLIPASGLLAFLDHPV